MRFLSAETSRAFMRRVILPLAALVVGLLVFAIGGIFWIADYQTKVAVEQQARLANGAFRIQAEKLATSASDYGYWDDAVASIAEKPDPVWMNENIGAGAEKSLGIDMAYALDPDGKAIYSYIASADGRDNPSKWLGDGFRHVFDAWKKHPQKRSFAGLLPYDGTAVAIAIAPVRSFSHADQKPTGYSIVFVKIVDAAFLQEMARDFELSNFRIVRSDASITNEMAVVSIDDGPAGKHVARFSWDPRQPGKGLLAIALPFMGLFLLLLMLLAAVVLNYVIGSAQLITDRENKASCDPLTGLANRSRFFAELELAIARIVPGLGGVAVMYVDLDGFKTINDTMGHAAGDELLVEAAGRFKRSVGDAGLVARLGGDEFAIIIHGKNDRSEIQAAGARILLAMAEPFHLAAGMAYASCSIGIAGGSDRTIRGADLLNQADHALYEAKASGKNALRFSGESPATAGRARKVA